MPFPLYLYALQLEIHLSREKVEIQITGLTPPHCCAERSLDVHD